MEKHYNYIITGAGCAGLSFLMRLLQEPKLNKQSILVIDSSEKKENDRTWCFWEQTNGLFDSIVFHKWKEVNFASTNFSSKLILHPYEYKMIQGIDFYNYAINYAKAFANVEWRFEKVKSVTTINNNAVAVLENEAITADYIFNSILFEKPVLKPTEYYLLQHFKGWVIQTNEPAFDPSVATFMDFTIDQKHGTTFMYMMPTSTTTALVEYTLFTEKLLEPQEYEQALKDYINKNLGVTNYTIEHEEFGIIPMTSHHFPLQQGKIIHMGIVGGQAKGSSGYAFQFIQKRTKKIIDSLLKNGHPFVKETLNDKKFHLYDSTLLHVLHHQKMASADIFAAIFKKNKTSTVFKFLDNESSLLEDLQIMSSVPTNVFLPAALKEMFR